MVQVGVIYKPGIIHKIMGKVPFNSSQDFANGSVIKLLVLILIPGIALALIDFIILPLEEDKLFHKTASFLAPRSSTMFLNLTPRYSSFNKSLFSWAIKPVALAL